MIYTYNFPYLICLNYMPTTSNSFEKEEHQKQKAKRAAILNEIKNKMVELGAEQAKFEDKMRHALTNLINAKLFDSESIDFMEKERQLFCIANKLIELSKLRKQGESPEKDAVQRELLILYKEFLV